MNKGKALDAVEHIDAAWIDEADGYRGKKGNNVWIRRGAAAACLCLAVAGAILWHKAAPPEPEEGSVVLTENGVTIPQRVFTVAAGRAVDMIAFFIYQGRCYVGYEWIRDADVAGEYLGTVTGSVDEWTSKDQYTELTGSVDGDFYAVKGYDPSFMLCMKDETGAVCTYVCDSGITLKYGRELFEDRLRLTGNYTAAEYETRRSWNDGENGLYRMEDELYRMEGGETLLQSFIEALDEAEFIPWKDVPAKEGYTDTTIYETEIYHMYFRMTDGTSVHLRLYENGYVRFQGLLKVCVQVPEDAFTPLVDLMENHTGAQRVR